MISVKEAFKAAVTFAEEALGTEYAAGGRLEEVSDENRDGDDVWVLTLSFPKSDEMLTTVERIQAATRGGGRPREYKTFVVDQQTGRVFSMKIRQLAFS